MGCASTRAYVEEGIITTNTVEVGFEKHSVERVVSAIRTHSTAKHITHSQFEALKKVLALNATDTVEFYKAFQSQEPGISQLVKSVAPHISDEQVAKGPLLHEEPLIALGILLSTGTPRDKALAFYRLFDEGFGNSLSESTLNEMFSLLFTLAIERLPILQKHGVTEDIKKYLAKAQQNKAKAVALAIALVKRKEAPGVGPEEFANNIVNHKNGLLTSASGLREFAADQAPKPKPQDPAAGKPTQPPQTSVKPPADKPAGDKPAGDKPVGDKPAGDKPAGDKPAGDKPAEPAHPAAPAKVEEAKQP